MAISPLETIYREFNSRIKESFALISAINTSVSTEGSTLKKEHVFSVYELAFLKIFTGWELFLGETFVAYMTGASIRGYKPKTYLKKIDARHALDLLSGTKAYPNWTSVADILTLAKLYFVNGEPFTLPLEEISVPLRHMNRIRNEIVHSPELARNTFMKLVKSEWSGYSQDTSPGEFLNVLRKKEPRVTFIEYYTSYLEAASSKIVKK